MADGCTLRYFLNMEVTIIQDKRNNVIFIFDSVIFTDKGCKNTLSPGKLQNKKSGPGNRSGPVQAGCSHIMLKLFLKA